MRFCIYNAALGYGNYDQTHCRRQIAGSKRALVGYELDIESRLFGSTCPLRSAYRLHTGTNGLVTHELETPSDAVGSAKASRSSTGLYSSLYDQYDVVHSSYEREKCSSGGGEASEHLRSRQMRDVPLPFR